MANQPGKHISMAETAADFVSFLGCFCSLHADYCHVQLQPYEAVVGMPARCNHVLGTCSF